VRYSHAFRHSKCISVFAAYPVGERVRNGTSSSLDAQTLQDYTNWHDLMQHFTSTPNFSQPVAPSAPVKEVDVQSAAATHPPCTPLKEQVPLTSGCLRDTANWLLAAARSNTPYTYTYIKYQHRRIQFSRRDVVKISRIVQPPLSLRTSSGIGCSRSSLVVQPAVSEAGSLPSLLACTVLLQTTLSLLLGGSTSAQDEARAEPRGLDILGREENLITSNDREILR